MKDEEEKAEYRFWRSMWSSVVDISERDDIKEMLEKMEGGENE